MPETTTRRAQTRAALTRTVFVAMALRNIWRDWWGQVRPERRER